MLQLTKIFHFEMAHAINGYSGPCQYIHGHSYELHVTVGLSNRNNFFLPAPGFVIDFKEIKQIIHQYVLNVFDHKLLLSKNFIAAHPEISSNENLVSWDVEPSVENLLIYIERSIAAKLPDELSLCELKLYETADSYARWVNNCVPA